MITRAFTKGDAASEAIYSDCERYRFELTRVWDAEGRRVLFVMLNPSTATERQNDPSVERCERRARALGYGAFRVCNIFAWRDTDPRGLRATADPVGAENDAALKRGCAWADDVICAWGTHGTLGDRERQALDVLRSEGARLHHLGLTKNGHPRHPLYIPYATQPVPWT